MNESIALSLLVITAAAVLAPLLAEAFRRWRVPSVLFELLLGIIIGPFVLGWAQPSSFLVGVSELGLALLFFVAGYELDFRRLRGAPLNKGLLGWGVSLALGLGVGLVLMVQGFVVSSLLVGLCLTTTAIGTLLPMLKDRGLLETRFGDYLAGAGSVGEFGPVVAVTLLLGSSSPGLELLLMALFVAVAVGAAFVATRPQPPRVVEVLRRNLSTSAQLPVRVVVLLLVAMVAMATQLGLDMLLGAFAAGLIARLAMSEEQAEVLKPRIEALGFGFFIPVFFIASGMKFDVTQLGDVGTIMRLVVFYLLLLAVRGLPALVIYRRDLPGRRRLALAFLQSTALPLLVVITTIGLDTGRMRPENATALVGAGMASVLMFPLVGFSLLGQGSDADQGGDTDQGDADQGDADREGGADRDHEAEAGAVDQEGLAVSDEPGAGGTR